MNSEWDVDGHWTQNTTHSGNEGATYGCKSVHKAPKATQENQILQTETWKNILLAFGDIFKLAVHLI